MISYTAIVVGLFLIVANAIGRRKKMYVEDGELIEK